MQHQSQFRAVCNMHDMKRNGLCLHVQAHQERPRRWKTNHIKGSSLLAGTTNRSGECLVLDCMPSVLHCGTLTQDG